ncbi:hypothetical protein DYH55_00310 [Methylovirgula sp. 4M-Z18]|nr:hypothetical protein DYH55_00310 [Methylovirgula sp. 4M-Z18]
MKKGPGGACWKNCWDSGSRRFELWDRSPNSAKIYQSFFEAVLCIETIEGLVAGQAHILAANTRDFNGNFNRQAHMMRLVFANTQ